MFKTKTIETLLKITKSSVVDSADGNFTVRLMTKATIKSNGLVVWKPPAIYKSLCPIDVEFFPFDEQRCTLKIGSWSFDGYAVDIRHKVSHWLYICVRVCVCACVCVRVPVRVRVRVRVRSGMRMHEDM